jgi:uncharacterized protein (DUF1778 family)
MKLAMYGNIPDIAVSSNSQSSKAPAMTSSAQTQRSTRVEARIAPDVLAVVRRAAEIQGRSVSDFLVVSAQEAAYRAIEDEQIIRLSLKDQQRFAELLLKPAPVKASMKRAFKAHRTLIASTP